MNWDFTKIATVLVLILGLTLGYFGGWWDGIFQKDDPPQPKLSPAGPGIDISEVKLVNWDKQKKEWEIRAKRIWQTVEGNLVYFENIEEGVAYSVKNQNVKFKAGWARWEKIRGKLYIGGGIEAGLDKGNFSTSEAEVNFRTQEMICNQPVQLNREDLFVKAKTMRINFSKEELFLEGDVELIQNNNLIRSSGLVYNLKEEKFHLVEPREVTLVP